MRLALAAALLASALFAQAADPVAFVADIRGNATIEGEGKLVTFLTELSPGTRLLLGSNAVASITYASSGAEFTIKGPGEFLVTATEVKAEKGTAPGRRDVLALVDPAIVTRTARAATASLRMRGIAPRADATALQFPVETRVATLQPILRWRGELGDATVTVFDAGGREIWKGRARPEGTRPAIKLAPATRYSWSVTTPTGTLGQAGFETLPAEAMARVEAARARARTFPERVLHAMLLQDLGAAQEAREAWGGLARERPDLLELAAFAR
ncbi:MAG: hypothetical protein ABIQ50_03245 [Usitatibacter sp.]